MKFLALVLLLVAVNAKHEQYIGWKSYFVGPSDYDQLKALGSMVQQYELDFLSFPSVGREGVVLVHPEYQDAFTKSLQDLSISYGIHVDNVKTRLDIDDQLIEARRQETITRKGGRIPYDNYQPLEVYDDYLDEIAAKYPEVATLVTPANSFEGRPIKYLKISSTNFEDESKPVIVIDGGIHAREWISPPTVAYAIHKLVEDLTEPDLLERFDWVLIPVANPDGYKFSFDSIFVTIEYLTFNRTFTLHSRFWRKTRSTDTHILSSACPGVDGNRNYDFFWNTVGVSSSPCSDTYPGNRAFSEIETRVVRDVLDEYLHRIPLYITMHSYGSMILYPWGHDGSLSGNAFGLHTVGIEMANAIHSKKLDNFPNYIVGNSVLVIGYAASGASEDYAHSIGVPLSYTYELPGLAGGFQGFHLDPRYIEQVCIETWEGIAAGARRAGDLFGR